MRGGMIVGIPHTVSGRQARPAAPAMGVVQKNTLPSFVSTDGACLLRVSMKACPGGVMAP